MSEPTIAALPAVPELAHHLDEANLEAGESPWPEKGDLPPERPEVPALLSKMLPAPLCPWLEDVAERACIPLEYLAAPTLVGLGSLVGRQLGICPGRFDDYLVVPNLWGAIIGRPGLMKSHAVTEALSPLHWLATKASQRFEAGRSDREARALGTEARKKALQSKMVRAEKNGGEQRHSLLQELRELIEGERADEIERRYLTQDPTVEKLGELLRDNPRGLLVERDEVAGWLRTLDKPGREGDREFYLESWNGTSAYTVDRIGRGTLHIPALCISVVGGIQPGKLKRYVAATLEGAAGDDGLLQRLQLLVWPDGPREWHNPDRPPNNDARRRAHAVFETLDQLDPAAFGASDQDDSIPYLRFAPDGQSVWDEWRDRLENRLRSDDELAGASSFEAHLSKYRSLMPSLALLFHVIETASKEEPAAGVGEKPVLMAAAWCDFLERHARKLYAAQLYPDNASARRLASKITKGALRDGNTVREIYRREWADLASPESVRQGLSVLEKIHWARVMCTLTGGRSTDTVRLHPSLRTPGG